MGCSRSPDNGGGEGGAAVKSTTVGGERARGDHGSSSCPEASARGWPRNRGWVAGAEAEAAGSGPDTVRPAVRTRVVIGTGGWVCWTRSHRPAETPGSAQGARPKPRAGRVRPSFRTRRGFTPFAKHCWGSPNLIDTRERLRAPVTPTAAPRPPAAGRLHPVGRAAGGVCTLPASFACGSSRGGGSC